MSDHTVREYIVREVWYPGAVKQELAGELVRCKDCLYIMRDKLKQDGTEDMRYKPDFCDLQKMHVTDEYFCADGKRGEE